MPDHEPQEGTASGPPGPDLREATLRGVKWTAAARVVAEAAAFVSSIALARLIAPAEFGATVVAVFVASLAQGISSQGAGSFLVHHANPTARHYRSAVAVCLLIGVAGAVFTAALGLFVAPPLFGQRAAELLLIATPTPLLSALAAVPMAQLQRMLDFRRLGIIDALSSLAWPTVAMSLAFAGVNAEAIVVGMIASSLVTAVLGYAWSPPPRAAWHRHEVREIWRYGAPATGSSLLYIATGNIDNVVLAARLGAAQVGFYARAFQLGFDYQAKISGILLRISFPVLSRAKDLSELRRVRARMVAVHATMLFPLLFGLIALAPAIVPFAYGQRWEPVAQLTQILAVGGLAAVLATGTGPLLLASGHAKALLIYNAVDLVAFAVVVLLAAPHGVVAVCWAVVAVRVVSYLGLQYAVVQRKIGISLAATLRNDGFPAGVGGLALLGVTLLIRHALDATAVPTGAVIVLSGTAGLLTYIAVIRLAFPKSWSDVALLYQRLNPRSFRRGRRLAADHS